MREVMKRRRIEVLCFTQGMDGTGGTGWILLVMTGIIPEAIPCVVLRTRQFLKKSQGFWTRSFLISMSHKNSLKASNTTPSPNLCRRNLEISSAQLPVASFVHWWIYPHVWWSKKRGKWDLEAFDFSWLSLFPKRKMTMVGHLGDLEASSFRGGSFWPINPTIHHYNTWRDLILDG